MERIRGAYEGQMRMLQDEIETTPPNDGRTPGEKGTVRIAAYFRRLAPCLRFVQMLWLW